MINALECFGDADRQRVAQTLERLLPFLKTDDFAIVGGLAIRYFIAASGQPYPARPFNDLDLILKHPETLDPAITHQFMVEHYHKTTEETYFAIVDPLTRTKLDLFQWPAVEVETVNVPVGRVKLPFQSVENQFAKTVLDTTKVFRNEVLDPKQLADASLLKAIAEPQRTSRIFAQLYGDRQPIFGSALAALEQAEKTAKIHPELLRAKPFHKTLPYQCRECVIDPRYPLTPLSDIHRILGYIE